jgi:hypothetical protein
LRGEGFARAAAIRRKTRAKTYEEANVSGRFAQLTRIT